jgi:hypothetical protein
MSVKKCGVCKGLLPEKLPYSSITVCSTNCFNKFEWKLHRDQMLIGGAFGVLLVWASSSANVSGVGFFSVCTIAFVLYKIKEMGDYPWT